ncbi:patatin phospholipase domain-containing protein 2-like [Tropilaelaps mercedesae]|uniref:triacylglycerol lipase n=1 Tax=Tropilaelaps mercedesae TaxID=418985 RepID=A0A1V9X1Q4_9ACAR|nr:patatin phospholipase domain-containing protein 2-like [Tropilaelaps mercedesae]
MPKMMRRGPIKGRDYHLSLSGCGFLGLYHVGVISAFHEYARQLCSNKIAGASAGSLAAACLICNVAFGRLVVTEKLGTAYGSRGWESGAESLTNRPFWPIGGGYQLMSLGRVCLRHGGTDDLDLLSEATTSILRVAVQARRRALGPFHPGFDINALLYDIFLRILPDNAHELCSGRLHVSLTRVSDGANVLLNRFSSKDELVIVLMCSCFIPFYSGLVPPKVNGVAYMDGGFSDNLPILDENTITVSPFSGENDICPEDESFNLMLIHLSNTSVAVSPANIYRLVRILFPPHPEILARMTQQGFDDAVKYLQRHNLISCTRCLAVRSSFDITQPEENNRTANSSLKTSVDIAPDKDTPPFIDSHPYDGCDDCKIQKQMAELASLPEPIREPMMKAAERENRGIVNWLFKQRPVKVLSLLTLPYVLPFDITMSVASKLLKLVPVLRRELSTSFFNVLDKLREIALAITEFNYNLDAARPVKMRSRSMENLRTVRSAVTDAQKRRQQRKSFAGVTYEKRVLSELNLGSKLPLAQTLSRSRKTSVMDALRSLDSGLPSVSSAIDLTNDMLDHERGSLHQSQAQSLDQMLDVTQRKEALMAFYYTDENNRVNVTEIFDVSESTETPQTSPERSSQGAPVGGNGGERRRRMPVY